MLNFIVIWSIHVLSWFLFAALCSVARGSPHGLKLQSAVALGSVSALYHVLVMFYFGGLS